MRDGGELVFALRLASHLRKSLHELLTGMTATEYALWLAFYRHFGFDVDRLEWVTANAGAVAAAAWGAKVKSEEIIPRFAPPDPQAKRRLLFDWLKSVKREQEAANGNGDKA